jgi:hypothetical protein
MCMQCPSWRTARRLQDKRRTVNADASSARFQRPNAQDKSVLRTARNGLPSLVHAARRPPERESARSAANGGLGHTTAFHWLRQPDGLHEDQSIPSPDICVCGC